MSTVNKQDAEVMIQFNREYTYGIGSFFYKLNFVDGELSVSCTGMGTLLSESAIRFHLFEAVKQEGFRYTK